MAAPKSLADLKKGASTDGDCGSDPTIPPPWLDLERLARTEVFLKKHAFTMALIWHCSLTIGFSLNSLLEALVFTGKSNTPQKSIARYTATFQRLLDWHMGNVFDSSTKAFSSVQDVRHMHAGVRMSMDQAHFKQSDKWITMYDMAVVQTGFMGALATIGDKFGLHCPAEQIADYVYFWKCIGHQVCPPLRLGSSDHQLGLPDQYNLCAGGLTDAQNIVWESIHEVRLQSSCA